MAVDLNNLEIRRQVVGETIVSCCGEEKVVSRNVSVEYLFHNNTWVEITTKQDCEQLHIARERKGDN